MSDLVPSESSSGLRGGFPSTAKHLRGAPKIRSGKTIKLASQHSKGSTHHVPNRSLNGTRRTFKLEQPSTPSSVEYQQEIDVGHDGPVDLVSTSQDALMEDGVTGNDYPEDSSESIGDRSRDLDTDSTSRDTPNSSMTSASLISPFRYGRTSSFRTGSDTPQKPTSATSKSDARSTSQWSFRPRSSIPPKLSPVAYAQQCIEAAYASRLNPYALHVDEHNLLRDRLCHLHVTVYLNIRNGILRLWTRNPLLSVTKEEAVGCARDSRWIQLACFAYEWLVRRGYINFGCVQNSLSQNRGRKSRQKPPSRPTIVIIGAGMAGLGCARQLRGLFEEFRDSLHPPRIIILEGRRRIGGRIYSHPLQSMSSETLALRLRPTAEMGAQIIVGFEHGNPLDAIIRGQLALHHHSLRDISTLYDVDGTPVDEVRDALVEKLYNDILDRAGHYRQKAKVVPSAEGNREMIDSGRDPSADDGVTIRQYEDATASGTIGLLLPTRSIRKGVGHKAAQPENSSGAEHINPQLPSQSPATLAAQSMGWKLRAGVQLDTSLGLDRIAHISNEQTLGAVMDEGVKQYQKLLFLKPRDMRLLNWHFANLEYANAANVEKLSLASWDQDIGNEFEGEHAEVVGGYQQVPRGLWRFPDKLDVRANKVVSQISYDPSQMPGSKAGVICEDGEIFVADKVILTAPLGVMKQELIQFEPPLPGWKAGAIDRLGFGLLNKVVLVFEKPFWNVDRDMFGLLRAPKRENSMFQQDYVTDRGKFYLFWNCMKTSGLPVLIALMAGDAAHQAELASDDKIISEVMGQLRNVFKHEAASDPLETIITRWGQDRFARGSYSFVGSQAQPGDYDLMAKPVGNLHFAGEATCGTHPATVHGAYLSGLRAASEVLESMIGPIEIPTPLVPPKIKTEPLAQTSTPITGQKRKEPPIYDQPPSVIAAPPQSAAREAYDTALWTAIYAALGPPPQRPAKTGVNPFLLYQKDHWLACKTRCDDVRKAATRNPNAKAGRDEVRQALGQMWREASEEEKKPYLEVTEKNRGSNKEAATGWAEAWRLWEKRTWEVKAEWEKEVGGFETWVKTWEEQKGANGVHAQREGEATAAKVGAA